MSQADTEELRGFVEDLATMARSGQSLSIISGFHLAWWGGVVALACTVRLLSVAQGLRLQDVHIWPAAMMIGWIGGRLLHKKMNLSERKGVLAYANRVTRYVWVTIGLAASLIVFLEVSQLADFSGRGYFMIFLMCGLGLVATSAACSEPLLLLSAAGWFLAGFASLLYPVTANTIYGITVIACVVFMILPGMIIGMRST